MKCEKESSNSLKSNFSHLPNRQKVDICIGVLRRLHRKILVLSNLRPSANPTGILKIKHYYFTNLMKDNINILPCLCVFLTK